MTTVKFKVSNLVCSSCEETIINELSKIPGVTSVHTDLTTSTIVIKYDNKKITEEDLQRKLKAIGYPVKTSSTIGSLIPFISIVLIIIFLSEFNLFSFDMTKMLSKGSFVIIFIIGLFTSFHCVGMCGGIMLTQTIDKTSAFKSSLAYNLGRVISYTLLGGIVGALGSVFSISPKIQGGIQILAATFMLIAALNLLDIPFLKKFSFKLPISCKMKSKTGNPFVVGILNGLMPCGPLQTMQLYALSTGSFYLGALSMFIFAIGTVPLMLAFGTIASLLTHNASKKLLKYSGYFLIILAFLMISRGTALLGYPIFSSNFSAENTKAKADSQKAKIINDTQEVTITATTNSYLPSTVYVKKGVPLKLIFKATSLSSCTNKIIIPELNEEVPLSTTTVQIVEFTPNESKTIPYSCWMGMKTGEIIVVDSLDNIDTSNNLENNNANPAPTGGCCN